MEIRIRIGVNMMLILNTSFLSPDSDKFFLWSILHGKFASVTLITIRTGGFFWLLFLWILTLDLFHVDARLGEPAAPRHQGEEAGREGDSRHLLQRYTSQCVQKEFWRSGMKFLTLIDRWIDFGQMIVVPRGSTDWRCWDMDIVCRLYFTCYSSVEQRNQIIGLIKKAWINKWAIWYRKE